MQHDARTAIREFILKNYLPGESPANLEDDTPLRTSGILDSLATLALVDFIDRQFGIDLTVYDTSVERFDTVFEIVACVERKTASVRVGAA